MKHDIENFPSQLAYNPEIKNGADLGAFKSYIVVGMGGSHLAADLLQSWKPELPLIVHSDYALPPLPDETLQKSLIILSSYSGNTEEVIDAFEKAREKKLSRIAISIGGKLLELAKKENVPYIELPNTEIQPRLAIGFAMKALLRVFGEEAALNELSACAETLNPKEYEDKGKAFAEELHGYIPVVYASEQNQAIVYNWKVAFQETAKIPAFGNVFPELNHNEMVGFDVRDATRELSQYFYFILLHDDADTSRIQKRMEVLEALYKERGLPVMRISLEGMSRIEKMLQSLFLAHWIAYFLALRYNIDPSDSFLVEEFKKRIA